MTDKPLSFTDTYVTETGLSDFHKMIVAVMKMHFPKMKPQVVSYRKYTNFLNKTFLDSLRLIQERFLNENGLDAFSIICTEMFDKHAPKKMIYMI